MSLLTYYYNSENDNKKVKIHLNEHFSSGSFQFLNNKYKRKGESP